ncbi:MAG: PhzF family phenazine biosynthesis protein [Actinomycetota bacterium]
MLPAGDDEFLAETRLVTRLRIGQNAPMRFPYHVVDVFTATPFLGNPVVVIDCITPGAAPTDEEMQRIAHWTNLSETTFLVPPSDAGADYAVRIFTPSFELPFAGHPTLGTCHVWNSLGVTQQRADRIVQECGIGLVELRNDGRLSFAAPPLQRSGPLDPDLRTEVIDTLGLEPASVVDTAWVDNGPEWIGVELASADDVLAITPSTTEHLIGVVGKHPANGPASIEVRAFFPVDGATREDPVTGSLNASLAMWLTQRGVLQTPYVARQGTALGRTGLVHVDDVDGQLWVGGDTVSSVTGELAT